MPATTSFLSRCEILIYFGVYIVYIVIGLYKIYELRDRILEEAQFQFSEGWSLFPFTQRRRDDSNDELENFGDFIAKFWPYYVLHVFVSGFLHSRWPKFLCYGYAGVCALALGLHLHWSSLAVFVTLVASYYLIGQTLRVRKRHVWLLSVAWIMWINVMKNSNWWYESVGYAEYVLVIVTLSWNLLRGCSYALEKITAMETKADQSSYELTHYLGYAMYFPCLAYGPIISYPRFAARQDQDSARPQDWTKLAVAVLRSGFWWLLMQCALHYFYIYYMARDSKMVAMMDSVFWQHSAGYFMGQFFFLYYVVTYGLGIAFAVHDGIPAPSRPRCIGRIHFYSDMWKYFDEGLYEFLFKHIYCELCGKQSSPAAKICATALTFAFVFVWHGCYTYVLIWSVLNFFCLAAEKVYRALISMPRYSDWTLRHLGPVGSQRLHAVLATQLFIPAAFSNVYFIGGQEIGDFLMRGAYLSGLGNYLALCFCSYCFFQCSELLVITRTKTKTKSN